MSLNEKPNLGLNEKKITFHIILPLKYIGAIEDIFLLFLDLGICPQIYPKIFALCPYVSFHKKEFFMGLVPWCILLSTNVKFCFFLKKKLLEKIEIGTG